MFSSEIQSLVLVGILIHRDTFIHSLTGHLGERLLCASPTKASPARQGRSPLVERDSEVLPGSRSFSGSNPQTQTIP